MYGGSAWRYTPVFDFDSEEGFSKMAALPAIQQERQMRDIQTLVAARGKGGDYPGGGKRGKKGGEERTGGIEGRKCQLTSNGEKGRPAYPTGPTLNAMEKRIGYPRIPLGGDGKGICYNFSTHSGCVKDNCSFSHQSRIHPEGIQWAVTYELARRGCLTTSKAIEPKSVEGCVQALREKNTFAIRKSIEESRSAIGRSRVAEGEICAESRSIQWKDSLVGEEGIANSPLAGYPRWKSSDVGRTIVKLPENIAGVKRVGDLVTVMGNQELTEETEPMCLAPQEFDDLAEHVNSCAQPIPRDFLRFDCADMENQ